MAWRGLFGRILRLRLDVPHAQYVFNRHCESDTSFEQELAEDGAYDDCERCDRAFRSIMAST